LFFFLQYIEKEKQLEDRLNNYEDNLENNNQDNVNNVYVEQPEQSRIIKMPDRNAKNNKKGGLLKRAGRWGVGAAAALLIMASPVGSGDFHNFPQNPVQRSGKASVISVYENLGKEIGELKKELRQAGLPDEQVREKIKEKYEKKIKDIREKLGLPDEQVRREAIKDARKGMVSEDRYQGLEQEYEDYRTAIVDLLEQKTGKLQEAKQDNQELEENYEELQQENDVLVDEYGKLAQDNQELEQENNKTEEEFETLQEKYHKETKEFAEYKAETQGNIARLRQVKQDLIQNNEGLDNKNKGLEQKLVRAGLPDDKIREQTTQKVMKKANQKYQELEAKFNKLKDKYEQESLEFQEFKKVAGDYKQNTQEEIRDLREDFGQATEQNQDLEQQLVDSRTELEKEIEERGLPDEQVRREARKGMVEEEKYDELLNENESLGKENQGLTDEYGKLAQENKELEQNYSELRKENGVLELEYGKLQTDYAENGRRFLDYKKQSKENIENLKLRNQGLEQDNKGLEQKLVIAGKPDEHVREQAIKDARKGMVEKEKYDELAQENKELQEETLILKDKSKEFSDRYELTIKDFSSYRKEKERLLEDKSKKLVEVRKENQELEQEHEKLEGAYEKLQREDNLLRISYNKLQEKYDENVEDFEEFIRKSISKTKGLKQENQGLEQRLEKAGLPDEQVWKETAQAMQDRYEPRIQELKDENQKTLEKLQTTNQRLKKYQELEQRRKMQEKEGMPIHKLVSNEIFKVPEFPLSWAVINEKEERFEQIHILEYNSQDGFGIIDTKQELSKLADSISKAYDPAVTSNKAFETLLEITGADKNLGQELEQGKEIATNFDKLAEFIFAYQKSLEKENKGKGIVPYRNKQGQLVVVGNHDNIINIKVFFSFCFLF
jgi:hypothetical protein